MDENVFLMKQLINQIGDKMEELGKFIDNPEINKKMVKHNFTLYALYLTCSDGQIGYSEANLLNQLFDENESPQFWKEYADYAHVYSKEFERAIPPLVRYAVACDIASYKSGTSSKIGSGVINAYKTLGALIVTADNNVDRNEATDLTMYLDMLNSYAKDAFYRGIRS